MPRGGYRAGSGRKPGSRPNGGIVLGMDGGRYRPSSTRLPPALSEEERAGLQEPPAELPEPVKACWRELAGWALAERTLTPATEPGFVELCWRLANVRAIDQRIELLGIATQDALPYLKERRGQASQLGASLKDFKLTAFGRPATSDKPKAAVNPFAGIAG